MANGHHDVSFRWLAGILATIVLALCAGWASNITNKVDMLQEVVSAIRSDLSAVRQILRGDRFR
jgi:hypothetical protein